MPKIGGALLQGVTEADKTYIGGTPRKPNKRVDRDLPKQDMVSHIEIKEGDLKCKRV